MPLSPALREYIQEHYKKNESPKKPANAPNCAGCGQFIGETNWGGEDLIVVGADIFNPGEPEYVPVCKRCWEKK